MRTCGLRRVWFPFALVFLITLLACPGPAGAVYVKRYTTIANGAVTFTGNTLGLSKQNDANAPGTAHSIGAFITTNTAVRDGTSWYYGTTPTWSLNSSSAVLTLPAGSTVLYAELIWGGSYNYGGENVSSSLNTSVSFNTPVGTFSISPTPSTSVTLTGENYYVRSADVSTIIQSGGAGTYTVGGVPGTQGSSENAANSAGWTLAVIYGNASLAARNMTIFVGGELTNSSTSTISSVTGFCTPQAGAISARMLVSTIEGDSSLTGDQMQFGPTTGSLAAVSGPNNPLNNFFCSQMNGDSGTLVTSGTFGTRNHTPGSNTTGGRQGWDITNIDVSSRLQNGQSSAYTRGTTNNDRYIINAVALQINVGAPVFPTAVMSVDKSSTYVGDTLTYTVRLDNTAGSATAQSVFFTGPMPAGTSFVAGSLTVNGTAQPLANPVNGVSLPDVAAGSVITLTYKALVNAIPPSPATAQYVNQASWTYQYQSCPGFPLNNGTISTNAVVTGTPRLDIAKSANPPGQVTPGEKVTYTITITNSGTAATAGSTLADPIPAGMAYVAGSTKLNGVAVADLSGAMPFAAARQVNGSGDAAGVVSVGKTATVTFDVNVAPSPPALITNTASVDPDGAGPAPVQQVSVTNPQVVADLGVTITDNQTTAIAGTTLTYVVRVTNNGPDKVISFNLFAPLPAVLQNPQYTASAGTYNKDTGAWSGLTLLAGQSATLTIAATLSPAATGSVAVPATVSVPPGVIDSNSSNNNASDTDTITLQADLAVAKTDGVPSVYPGGTVTYAITAINNGPSLVTSLSIVDTLPAALLTPVFTPGEGVYNEETGLWTGLNLAPGQNVILTLTAAVAPTAQGQVINTATISPPTGVTDPVPGNNTATDTDIIAKGAVLSLQKSVDKASALPGEVVTYTLYYRNIGDAAATAAVITDSSPLYTGYFPNSLRMGNAASTYQTATPKTDAADSDGASASGGNVFFTVVTVAPDDGAPGSGLDEGKAYFQVKIQ